MNLQVLLDELLQVGLIFISRVGSTALLQLCVQLGWTKDHHLAAERTGRERERESKNKGINLHSNNLERVFNFPTELTLQSQTRPSPPWSLCVQSGSSV